MLPKFDERGQLQPGMRRLARSEFASAFGHNDRRRMLIGGPHHAGGRPRGRRRTRAEFAGGRMSPAAGANMWKIR